MSNTPKLRFPEFKGEWEEKRLSDIASFSKGKGYTKNDLVNDGSPIILYGRMYTKYETVISDIDTFVNLQEGSIISKGGEIIVPASGETAEEISRASVVKNEGIILGGDLNIISLQKDKYNPEFFALTISSGTSQKRLSKLAQGKSVVHLHNEDLRGLQIKVPTLAEQQKIADFLSNVDSIITAEIKILNTLQKKKKALMQKLFTQQFRFKSDDGTDFPAWEEKKLISEFPFIRNGFVGVVTDSFTTEIDGIKYIEGTNIHDGKISSSINLFVTKEFHNTHKNSQLKENDILMVQSGHVGETAVVPKELENSNCHALIIMSNGGNCSSEYVNYYFQSNKGKKQLSILTTGSTIKHILASDMQKFICPFPCREEQQKIADCLSSIDSLIRTQQKVVTTWQQRKKALLQQMFI